MNTNNSDMDFLKDAPTLASISNENPFTIPSNYFETLTERIENRINLATIQTLVPTDGFQVPVGYFAELTNRIHSKTQENKVLGRKKNMFSSWVSYSAAASVAMVIGVFLYFNSSVYSINNKLADVPDQEIINYLQIHSTLADTPYIIENLSEDGLQDVSTDVSSEDLEQYINSTTL